MKDTETLLTERCEKEMSGVTPDVAAIVRAGVESGRRLHRHRQILVGAIAAVAVVLATAGVTAMQQGIFDDDSSGPAHPGIIEPLEPATERGLAAAVIAHLPDGYEGGAAGISDTQQGVFGVAIGVSRELQSELYVMATQNPSHWTEFEDSACRGPMPCTHLTTPEGVEVLAAQDSRQGYATVGAAARRDSEFVFATVSAVTEDANQVPLTVDDLVAIVTDPLVGLSTSSEMNERGLEIEPWSDDLSGGPDTGEDSSSGSAVVTSVGPPVREDGPGSTDESSSAGEGRSGGAPPADPGQDGGR